MGTAKNSVSLQDLQSAWHESATSESVKDPNTQWLLGGVNLRVNALKALKAVYLSTKLYLEGTLVLATGAIGPVEIASLGKNLFDVVVTTLDALRERLRKSTYVACVVLAGAPAGLTPAELEHELKAFLVGAEATRLPFYMGFTESFLRDARNEIGAPGAFAVILEDLRQGKWVTVADDGRLSFKERHFVWGASTFG